MRRGFHFIINPASGRGSVSSAVRRVRARLAASGHEVEIHTTGGPGDATTIASHLPERAIAAIAVGGDGTVREVSEGLLGREIPLAILPAGTENLVARQFRFRRSPERLLQTLLNGTERRIDVGRVGSHIFLVVAGIGYDAEVVRRLSHRRRGPITYIDYCIPMWRTFWEHRFPHLKVRVDGQEVFSGHGLVLAGNMPQYGMRLKILREAVVDDGQFDVCIFPCASRLKLLLHAGRVACGQHLASGDVLYLQGRVIEVSSHQVVPVELDGDFGGQLPLRIEVLPRTLSLLVPPA